MDTPTLDFLINNPRTPSTPTRPSHASALATLLQNWPETPSLLPPHIPHDLTPALLAALAALSHLTRDDPERAWRLVETYYTCRIREGARRGNGGGGLDVDVGDVDKAVESARRMSVGRGMEAEGRGRGYSIRDEGEVAGKRKWSIRDEVHVGLPPLSELEERFEKRPLRPLKKALTIAIPSSAAQAATHAANLARLELGAAEECLNAARARYADAQRRYGEAKRTVKRARLGM